MSRLSPDRAALLDALRARRDEAAARRDHEPVPMRPGDDAGGAATVVLLHPAGGELFCYTPLVRALPDGPAVLGFPADPTDLDLSMADRIPVVAERTLAGLARVVDPARCVLAGWSYGGMVAFEMARRADGHPPVVLIDANYYGDVELDDEDTLRRRFAYDLSRLVGRDDASVQTGLAEIDPAPDEPAGPQLRAMLTAAGADVPFTTADLEARYATFRGCALALQFHEPDGPYDGPVTLVLAADATGVEEHWAAVCTGAFRVDRLTSDHYTLFAPAALDAVAGAIADAVGVDSVH